jgi:DNA polymerase elongation subunit (family B)
MYGALGVKRGYLPLMPGAMCVTYMGRTNIQKVSRDIQELHQGKLIYGDTDSNYVCFPHLTTAQETWAYALKVADEISVQFPPPIRIDF